MLPAFVLVHSPSVGPLTWAPVADELAARGLDSVVPSLLDIAEEGPPFWPRIVERVARTSDRLDRDRQVIFVAHSNAGLFVPLLVHRANRPVSGCLFVDAALPAEAPTSQVAPDQLLDVLRDKASDGLLPPWTDWWDEDEVAPLFPSADVRAAVSAEQPRLPLAYYEQQVPVPAGWDDVPCGYLFYGPPYDELADDARRRGWPVERVPGLHLHQLVEPAAVTDRLVSMARQLTTS